MPTVIGPTNVKWMAGVSPDKYWRELKIRGHRRMKRALYLSKNGVTLRVIGEELGVSGERARQMIAKAKRLYL